VSKRIIVTGGAGFIGSHLTDRLIELGHNVMVVDNLSTGNKHHVHPEADFVHLDIAAPELERLFVRFRPDTVYHLAAQVSVARSIEKPYLDAHSNIMGTLSVLHASKAAAARKVIYASSAAIYGVPETAIIDESHRLQPMSFYGLSKRVPEQFSALYRELFDVDFTTLRYANVYGGRQDAHGEGGVVSIFASRLLAGQVPIIYGDGEQTRDFVYVKDVVSANLAAMDRASGLTMNVGSGRKTSINELLSMMCRVQGIEVQAEYRPAKAGDIRDSALDNSLAVSELGWAPAYPLERGLQETIEFYREELTANNRSSTNR